MSKYFAEKNSENTFELFNKRQIYKTMLFRGANRNIVSFSDGEKIFYGRLDRKFVPISVGTRALKQINNIAADISTQQAVNFVADMFNEMCLQFQKCVVKGQIDASDPFLSNLKAYKAYVDPKKEYLAHYKVYNDGIKTLMYNRQLNRFKDFDEFVSILMRVLKTSVIDQPYTYAGFLKSNNVTVMSTGLAIEIAESSYMNDFDKYNELVKSKNWQFFVNTCNTYGFMIDYNVPWRIVADIGAQEVLKYSRKYGPETVDQIFAFQYEKSSKYGVEILKKMLYELYNYVKLDSYDETETCRDGSLIKRQIYPKLYAPNVFYEKYSDEYFTKIYLTLRMIEEQPNIDEVEREKIITEQMKLLNTPKNRNKVYTRFESIINRPFDKVGSLSYSVYAQQLRDLEAFEQGEGTIILNTGGSSDISGY